MRQCPACKTRTTVLSWDKFCPRCGSETIEISLPKCRQCDNELYSSEKFCTGCGLSRKEALGETSKGFWARIWEAIKFYFV